jgi:predicted HTH domain antitoxin
MTTLQLELPEELARASGHPQGELERMALEALLTRLYSEGRVSSGHAGKALGLSKVAFLELLGRYGVSSFDPAQDVAAEAQQLQRLQGGPASAK